MAGDERSQSFLRAVPNVFLQREPVVPFQHLEVNAADPGKVTTLCRWRSRSRRGRAALAFVALFLLAGAHFDWRPTQE